MGSARGTAESFTIDQLAARTSTSVRTLRFYATQGLLPPPERRGRLGYYGNQHRMRLELIRTLQEHGYTLAAIERVLNRIPPNATAAEYAVQAAVLAPWLPDEHERLSRDELDERAGRRLDGAELSYLIEIGAVERVEDDEFRASPGVLVHALDLLHSPVPVATLRRSAQIIEEHATAVANGLTDIFIEAIWGPYQRGELDHDEVLTVLEQLRPLALQGLVASFGRAADKAARRGSHRSDTDQAFGPPAT
jgi:DNA-binding transcriptional MerR regulator